GDIERLSLRHAFDDVEQHYVAEILQSYEQRQRAANLPGADQCDLVACHRRSSGHADCVRCGITRVLARKVARGKGGLPLPAPTPQPEFAPLPGTFRFPSI